MDEAGASGVPPPRLLAPLAHHLLGVMDLLVVLYAGATALYLTLGPIAVGPVGVRRLSKPFLVLLVLASLRAAIPCPSWLSRAVARGRASLVAAGRSLLARSPWARSGAEAAGAVLVVQVVAKLSAFLANVVLTPARPRPFGLPFDRVKLAETFAAWDSGWYFDIAQRGYYFNASGQSSIAFFPLYPLLMRALAWPFGGTPRALWLAGIGLSCACLLAGLTVLHRLTWRMVGDYEAARRTVLYVAVFPFAYFFTQVYTESLFLLLSVSAVAAAVAGGWGWAGLLGGLTALTRPNGVLIAVPLCLLAIAGRPRPAQIAWRAVALLPVPLGLVAFCAYSSRLSGDALGWLHAQSQWGYTVGNPPWVELMRLVDAIDSRGPYGYFFSDPLAPYYFLHGAVALALVALLPFLFARLGPALGAYVAVSLYVPLTGNALEGIGRYAATLFPVFMLLGTVPSKRIHEAILIGSALVLSLLSSLFVAFYPVY